MLDTLYYTWCLYYLLVAVCVLGFLSYELDPVLDLSHPGINSVAGALAAKAHHANLGESKYI